MARKSKDYDEYDELEEAEDEYDDYEDDYEDDDDYDDYYEPRRKNPLKAFVIALLVLLVVMAAIIGLLYARLRSANNQVTQLNASLEASRTEINNLISEREAAAAAVPESTPVPTPMPTPEPIPETIPVTEYRERTIPASRSNRQGVGINVRYTDNSGTHIIKREIYTDSPLTIGRASSNKVVLSDGRASDTHAQILYDSLNGMVVEDLGSTNGVQVNGETIMRKSRITKDDTVRIGDSKLSFEVTGTLDETGGEKTIAAGSRYHAPLRMVLTFTDDGGPRKENVVLKESAMIGKDRDCDVSVVSPTVSRKHAQLVNLGGGKAGIKDYNSTNYTYVNGVMASETVELKEGDVIKLGNVEMRVSYR